MEGSGREVALAQQNASKGRKLDSAQHASEAQDFESDSSTDAVARAHAVI